MSNGASRRPKSERSRGRARAARGRCPTARARGKAAVPRSLAERREPLVQARVVGHVAAALRRRAAGRRRGAPASRSKKALLPALMSGPARPSQVEPVEVELAHPPRNASTARAPLDRARGPRSPRRRRARAPASPRGRRDLHRLLDRPAPGVRPGTRLDEDLERPLGPASAGIVTPSRSRRGNRSRTRGRRRARRDRRSAAGSTSSFARKTRETPKRGRRALRDVRDRHPPGARRELALVELRRHRRLAVRREETPCSAHHRAMRSTLCSSALSLRTSAGRGDRRRGIPLLLADRADGHAVRRREALNRQSTGSLSNSSMRIE